MKQLIVLLLVTLMISCVDENNREGVPLKTETSRVEIRYQTSGVRDTITVTHSGNLKLYSTGELYDENHKTLAVGISSYRVLSSY